MSDYTINATAGSLLGFLHEGPKTGWDLITVAQRRIGEFWSITQSQVYRELHAMAKAGLVEAGARGVRDRQPFTITDQGRAAFQDWVLQDPGRELIRYPLLITILFGRHLPAGRLAEIVTEHEEMHAARLATYRAIEAGIPESGSSRNPYSLATLHYGIAYEEATLQWFRELPERISGSAETIGQATPGEEPTVS